MRFLTATGGGCDIPAGLHSLLADALSHQYVGVVEILEEFGEERVTISLDGRLDSGEDLFVQPLDCPVLSRYGGTPERITGRGFGHYGIGSDMSRRC